MKNFQIFLKDGHVRYAAADRIEVGRSQVILYAEDRIVATYEKSSVIMLDEFQINGFSAAGETGRALPNASTLHYKNSAPKAAVS